jgi:hypothetical protein
MEPKRKVGWLHNSWEELASYSSGDLDNHITSVLHITIHLFSVRACSVHIYIYMHSLQSCMPSKYIDYQEYKANDSVAVRL